MVLHGDAGPASAWAERARPGDPVALWGPATAYAPPTGTDWYLLVADETGLPTVAVILESLPEGIRPGRSPRSRTSPSATSCRTSPVRGHLAAPDGAPVGHDHAAGRRGAGHPVARRHAYVWGGGESRTMTAVRSYVRHEVGLAREQVSLVAYWRHDAHAGDPDDDE